VTNDGNRATRAIKIDHTLPMIFNDVRATLASKDCECPLSGNQRCALSDRIWPKHTNFAAFVAIDPEKTVAAGGFGEVRSLDELDSARVPGAGTWTGFSIV
jgi:hypothetical protein